ncbi:spore cortex-lytic enzyme [Robertmurraya yapensis]|uniref:Spore cortex-lytic enzyme n=2 Tax=Bacillaceae TaxID=186817 RepID=A0A3S0ISD8_9BACI|nr:spore cortex-lytic enzyme [Bacillus yapensis]RTR30414.1 spore cortex-lytic enzyme [Bacillus yapensis]TKS95233.1 spore cortex-lytic enzyme [Bacillus yapensis]
MNKRFIKILLILSVCIICVPLSMNEKTVDAFSNQVIQHGAVGDDVIELQSRLQYLGFYTGKIDGVFGWRTYWALRNFQYEFGLPIDGLAGQTTKNKLAKASKYNEQFVKEQINKGNKFSHYGGMDLNKQSAPNKTGGGGTTNKGGATGGNAAKAPAQQQAAPKAPANQPQQQAAPKAPANPPKQPTAANVPAGFSQNDIQLMANAVYGESRGEPYIGQVAVAAVILNRVDSASFPNTVSGVIFEPRAFTAVADGQIWLTPNEQAKEAVLDAINGYDPTGNAIYYFNPDTATSGWIWTRPQIKQIGKHIFCK